MQLVLDSNEYIFTFGVSKESSCVNLLYYFLEYFHKHKIYICRTIVDEVNRNLHKFDSDDFYDFITALTHIDEDYLVPFELGAKYQNLGLKPGDAFISAYADYIAADFLVSENRHFLTRRTDLPFKVVTATDCLRILKTVL